MTKKDTSSKTTIKRASIFFILFSLGVVIFEIIRYLTPHRSPLTTSLCLALIVVLALAGTFFFNERTILSRVTSGCTLLILGFIGIAFAGLPIYLLPLALGVSYIGSLPALHHQPRNLSRVVLYSIYVLLATLLFILAFIYSTTLLNNVLISTNL
jgi:hypothetical protein